MKPGELRKGDKVTLTVRGQPMYWSDTASGIHFNEASNTTLIANDADLDVSRPERMVEVPELFIDAAKAWRSRIITGPPDLYTDPVNGLVAAIDALDEQATS